MKIKVERTGGFAGITTSNEIDSDDLPASMTNSVRHLLNGKALTTMPSIPKGAADHLNYKITIQNGNTGKTVECNQYNMSKQLKEIIKFVEEKSKRNKLQKQL